MRLLNFSPNVPKVSPHLGTSGVLCYIAKGTVVLDIFDPVGQTLACLKRAGEVLEAVLQGKLVDDLEEEFYAHWPGVHCLVDIQDQRQGRQETIFIEMGEKKVAVVSDCEGRTRIKLKALKWDVNDQHPLLTYRVRTNAKPRPHVDMAWPPQTVKDLLRWQALLDPRCRKKIEKRLLQAMATETKGVLVLIESPLLTYGVTVFFHREPVRRGMRRAPRVSLGSLDVIPMSVIRIDDRYMAQRNSPGKQTLERKHIVLVGCGTIGGYLAEMLVKSGAGTSGGQLTLVDFESMAPQNIGRHKLGFPSLFSNKATALADELLRSAPGAKVRALPVDVRKAHLGGFDLLIDVTGEEALGHWLSSQYHTTGPVLTAWIDGPGIAVRSFLADKNRACYRCLCQTNREGKLGAVVGEFPMVMAGQGCEGLYVPFPASVSVQAAALAVEMALAWANGSTTPALRTKILDPRWELATSDCDPLRREDCPVCSS